MNMNRREFNAVGDKRLGKFFTNDEMPPLLPFNHLSYTKGFVLVIAWIFC